MGNKEKMSWVIDKACEKVKIYTQTYTYVELLYILLMLLHGVNTLIYVRI